MVAFSYFHIIHYPKQFFKLNKKKELIADINSTVNSLANKKYETAKNLIQPDFILMYIPLESVLTLIYTDSDFLSVVKNANEKNIIIVGNSSILTTLRLVNLLWAQNKQQENIENIIKNEIDYNNYLTSLIDLSRYKYL